MGLTIRYHGSVEKDKNNVPKGAMGDKILEKYNEFINNLEEVSSFDEMRKRCQDLHPCGGGGGPGTMSYSEKLNGKWRVVVRYRQADNLVVVMGVTDHDYDGVARRQVAMDAYREAQKMFPGL